MAQPGKVVALKPRRHSKEPEELNLDEMWNSPSMKGMLSFLDVSPEERLVLMEKREKALRGRSDALETGTPVTESGAPDKQGDPLAQSGTPETKTGAPVTAPDSSLEKADLSIVTGVLDGLNSRQSGTPATETGAPVIAQQEIVSADASLVSGLPLQTTSAVIETGTPGTESGVPHSSETADQSGTPVSETGTPFSHTGVVVGVVRKPRPWTNVQDAHSHGEQQLYQTLWRLADGPKGGDRTITIGIGGLFRQVPMTYNNCAHALRSLASKLAIEDQGTRGNLGRKYVIYSYDSILRRRRAAGLTYILRTSRGVQLLSAVTGTPFMQTGTPATGTPVSRRGVPIPGEKGTPVAGTPIRNKEIDEETTSSSSFDAPIPTAIRKHLNVPIDCEAVRRIEHSCRTNVPDITEDEISQLVEERAAYVAYMLKNNAKVPSPMGLLITAVPKAATADRIARIREAKRKLAEDWERLSQELETEKGSD